MAQPRYSAVGDYVVGKQIGAGSFSTVWHGRHRVNGTEVAIKEIATARLNPKLQGSLKSEIFILKRINHPNITRLYDVIEEPGYLYIVLEFCKGGDLSMYIHKRHGEVSEATAKHFMQQLAVGLKVLRENNVIHRDLKPQNLLLSTNDDSTILKIADFGFARSLQPRDVAETLCGSPLYMAPEILQLQKYDAKADLWSVGTILFQLVTGKTPFTGCNQMQLLQNIKSTELQFPPDAKDLSPHRLDLCRKLLRRNPVERLTFEEFFNHPYLSKRQQIDSSSQPQRVSVGSSISGRNTEESSQEDRLSSSRDNDSCLPVCSSPKRSAMRSMHELSLDSKSELRDYLNLTNRTVADSLELIIKDYVIVSGNTEMPDAMELIYQSALAFGKRGAVDEYMGNNGNAVAFYSKAARLLQFLDAEAPRVVLNPPFSLTGLDRQPHQDLHLHVE